MLESVDFSQPLLSKEEYRLQRGLAMEKLVVLQQQAHAKGIGLVVLFEGWNGAGKGSRISDLMYHLDARATSVYVTPDMDVKTARTFAGIEAGVSGYFPLMQEFWHALGERGTMTFFDRGWYSAASQHMLYAEFGDLLAARGRKNRARETKKALNAMLGGASEERHKNSLDRYLGSTANFERQLVDDGYVVVKFFVHVREAAQKKRLERLHSDPATRWRVSEEKLSRVSNYEAAYKLYNRLLEGSDFSFASWTLVNGEDKRAANLHIAQTLVSALEDALEVASSVEAHTFEEKLPAAAVQAPATKPVEASAPRTEPAVEDVDAATYKAAQRMAVQQSACAPPWSLFPIVANYPRIDEVDHTLSLDENEYRAQLKQEQKRLYLLEMEMYQRRIPLMIMYEGWDAAGKGGNIKRVAQALDARAYTIFPSPAPTKPELMHPHLWRYWTRLPKAGHVGIYDRSWYGRVLVERVEGFATVTEWSRAYDEINEFERDMVRWGAILLKFWVDVSPEEQLNRFRERQSNPAKQWKITDDDWRNREKYPQYKAAVDDMFRLTSTPFAPWIVLESDNKYHARVKALKIINDTLEARLREN